jgi:hypothetical protein
MIKRFKDFINEEVSGTELPTGPGGSFGSAFGETRLQNKTISSHDTTIVSAGDDDNVGLYTEDEYNELYTRFLGSGGSISELKDISGDVSFSPETAKVNIDFMLDFLQER